jgi:hypothetical protein
VGGGGGQYGLLVRPTWGLRGMPLPSLYVKRGSDVYYNIRTIVLLNATLVFNFYTSEIDLSCTTVEKHTAVS